MCSYCGCENIEVIGRFMGEHVDLVNAAGVLRRAIGAADPAAVRAAATALAELLTPHTVAEEAGLFTVMARDEEFSDHIERLCSEHEDLDAALAGIADGAWERYPAFERALRDHIDREDNGLFPAAAIAFAGPEWDEVHDLTPPPAAVAGQPS
ncbi:MAG TPA: hemerythrin domain-containing protein [Intrasporangiaceae bacterium]|nr:hemerythrin domain-containing protein [Intrasporangiaceae bacterium]